MKLTYRGVDYDYNPPMLEATESEIKCQYRGQPCHYSYVQHVPIPQPAEQLTYRGVPYQTTRQGQVLQIADTRVSDAHRSIFGRPSDQTRANTTTQTTHVSAVSLRDKLMGTSSAAQARRQLLQSASQLHQDSIVRSLQHRMDVAKQQGNERLLEQLEMEMSQSV